MKSLKMFEKTYIRRVIPSFSSAFKTLLTSSTRNTPSDTNALPTHLNKCVSTKN